MLFKHSLGGDVIGSLLQGFVGQGIDLPEQKTIDKNDKGGRDHANDGSTHVGANGNYLVYVDATATVPLATFEGQVSTSTYAYLNPAFATPVANNSIIQ